MNRNSELLKEEGDKVVKQHKTVSDVGRQAVDGNNFCKVEKRTKHYLEFFETL